ncbi:unnamed protein product [Brassicogethes aeneus]|uniref:Uncharacterized protein n=1 Tax=Brassicogethes aeneus TaxID=1431903 RepID=A0A9P0AWH6_BRAAE|nr:unnamed protein product [Brassicogethes aeneus]
MNNKLMFFLCRTCGENMFNGECLHTEEDRALSGTWVIDEYNIDQKTGGLFTEMMNKFIKIKQEASGWPGNSASDKQKSKYIEEFFNREGIKLEFDAILNNPGLRFNDPRYGDVSEDMQLGQDGAHVARNPENSAILASMSQPDELSPAESNPSGLDLRLRVILLDLTPQDSTFRVTLMNLLGRIILLNSSRLNTVLLDSTLLGSFLQSIPLSGAFLWTIVRLTRTDLLVALILVEILRWDMSILRVLLSLSSEEVYWRSQISTTELVCKFWIRNLRN